MFKKIEKIIFQRNPSFTSVSTASSNNSGTSKTTNSSNTLPLSKNPSGISQVPAVHFPSPPLDQIVMDLKLNKINSRNLSNFSGGDEITSNLACDGYQGLFAIAYMGLGKCIKLKIKRLGWMVWQPVSARCLKHDAIR